MNDDDLLNQELKDLGDELRSAPSVAEAVMRRIARGDRQELQPEEFKSPSAPEHFAQQVSARDVGASPWSGMRGGRWVTAAVCLFLILWFGAQTKAWGQVAANLQQTAVAESAGSQSPSTAPNEVGSVMRFVLLLHVFSHLGGTLGLSIVWVIAQWDWLRAMWHPATAPHRTRKIHVASLFLYGATIALGSCWSQATVDTFWRWDPREAFALLTLCVGIVWSLSMDPVQDRSVLQTIRQTMIASMSFGLIVLMQSLAISFSRKNQSYGFSSDRLPTIVVILLAVNLAVLVASRCWLARKQSSSAI